MVNKDIENYISEGKRRGFDIQLLKKKLIEGGFDEREVDSSVAYVEAQSVKSSGKNSSHWDDRAEFPNLYGHTSNRSPNISSSSTEKLTILKKIGMSFKHPYELFEKTKGEEIIPAVKYLLITLLIPLFIGLLLSFFGAQFLMSQVDGILQGFGVAGFGSDSNMQLALSMAGFFGFFLYVGYPLALFVSAAITHVFAQLFKGKGAFKETFGALVYAYTPYHILIFLAPITMIWSFVLSVFGISIRHEMSRMRAFFAVITPTIIFLVIWGIAFATLFILGK